MKPSNEIISQVMRLIGSKGGTNRAKNMTPEQRRANALKASRAAAAARTRAAKLRKLTKAITEGSTELLKRSEANARKAKKKATA